MFRVMKRLMISTVTQAAWLLLRRIWNVSVFACSRNNGRYMIYGVRYTIIRKLFWPCLKISQDNDMCWYKNMVSLNQMEVRQWSNTPSVRIDFYVTKSNYRHRAFLTHWVKKIIKHIKLLVYMYMCFSHLTQNSWTRGTVTLINSSWCKTCWTSHSIIVNCVTVPF